MSWQHNDLAALAEISLSLSLHLTLSLLHYLLLWNHDFTYSFTINGYDVTVIIDFFPHIVVLEDFSDDESESVDVSFDL